MTRTPVVFVHGLWLHATSWGPWLDLFREAGYDPIAPGWPGEPATVDEARAHPEHAAHVSIDDATGHLLEAQLAVQRQRPVQSGPDQRHLDEIVEMAGLQRGVLTIVGEAEYLLRLARQIRGSHGANRGQGQQGRRGAAALAG